MSDKTVEAEVRGEIEESTADYLHRTNARRALTGMYIVWLRDLKRFWRDTPRRVGAFVQPLIYLFLLGTGLQAAFKVFGGGNTKYILFMFPGILGMTVLFTSVFSAISILWDREFGFLKEILVSPVPRSSVAFGKIIGGASQAMIQGMILLILMFFPFMYGFNVDTLLKALALIPLTLLLAIGMTSIGVAIAANMKSMEGFPMVMNFLLLPLFFLSGAMFPLQGLPGWMNFLTKINPLSYGVDMLRGVTLRGVNVTGAAPSLLSKIPQQVLTQLPPQLKSALATAGSQMKLQTQRYPLWLDVTVVACFTIAMLIIAIWQFSRQT
ncbi:MAG: ABC transporter permease [Candidatus Geothermincolia bacterium]